MDTKEFNERFLSTEFSRELYDRVYVIFVTLDDEVGDYCELEDRTLHLVLHVEPATESMIKTFERNFFEPAEKTT